MARLPDSVASVLFGHTTLVVFGLLGALVALAEWAILPQEALLVGAPALAAALLVDTFLYNEFLVRTDGGIWLFIAVFLYAEAALVVAVISAIRALVTKRA